MTKRWARKLRPSDEVPTADIDTVKIASNREDAKLGRSVANSATAVGRLAVIDPRPLTRQSLVEMLARGLPDYVIVGVSSCQQLLNGPDKPEHEPGLILLNTGFGGVEGASVKDALQWLTLWLPSARVIVLSDAEDAEEVGGLLAAGVRGYLPTSANPEVAFAAVRLVHAGGTYVPGQLFRKTAIPLEAARQQTRVGLPVPDLTPREVAVVELVRRGKPNKVIGFELKMQESTVKVHVRNIMRKFQAENRTQVALAADLLARDAHE